MNLEEQNLRRAFSRQKDRQHCAQLSLHALELISLLQQHRGMVLAVLGGDVFFETRVETIRPQVIDQLRVLKQFVSELFPEAEWQRLCDEWYTLSHHWRQDSASESFDLHTHVIQQMLLLLRTYNNAGVFDQISESDRRLAYLTLNQLPELMETAAEIRGIATFLLARQSMDKGASSAANHAPLALKLQYLHKYFDESLQRLEQQSPDLQEPTSLEQERLARHWQELNVYWQQIQPSLKLFGLQPRPSRYPVRRRRAVGRSTAKDTPAASAAANGSEALLPDEHVQLFFNEISELVFSIQRLIKLGLAAIPRMTEPSLAEWIDIAPPAQSRGPRGLLRH
ncbi:hypothetical protein [Allohahella marinimesophila]|uniref:Uncharacterized protein n=1 Tax=Allohahella marinimesophila TaxID=1054972 RepID=A0ABP7PAJ9_9GAMM